MDGFRDGCQEDIVECDFHLWGGKFFGAFLHKLRRDVWHELDVLVIGELSIDFNRFEAVSLRLEQHEEDHSQVDEVEGHASLDQDVLQPAESHHDGWVVVLARLIRQLNEHQHVCDAVCEGVVHLVHEDRLLLVVVRDEEAAPLQVV